MLRGEKHVAGEGMGGRFGKEAAIVDDDGDYRVKRENETHLVPASEPLYILKHNLEMTLT